MEGMFVFAEARPLIECDLRAVANSSFILVRNNSTVCCFTNSGVRNMPRSSILATPPLVSATRNPRMRFAPATPAKNAAPLHRRVCFSTILSNQPDRYAGQTSLENLCWKCGSVIAVIGRPPPRTAADHPVDCKLFINSRQLFASAVLHR